MKIMYLKNMGISFNIKEYITEALKDLGEDVYQVVTSLAERCMFTVGKLRGL